MSVRWYVLLIGLSIIRGQTVTVEDSQTEERTLSPLLTNQTQSTEVSANSSPVPLDPTAPGKPEPISIGLLGVDNYTALENQLFTACAPACEHEGVCRQNVRTQAPQCLCPLDFTGVSCERAAHPGLKTCTDNTCRNGGDCAGTMAAPHCRCPAGVAGLVCERRLRSFEVILKLFDKGQPVVWNQSFSNPHDSVYEHLSEAATALVRLAVKLGDDLMLVRTFNSTVFAGFHNGSVLASVLAKFDLNDSLASVYTDRHIRAHLITGASELLPLLQSTPLMIPTDFGQTNASTLVVRAIDSCEAGMHDCSPNAQCVVISPGLYTCTCNTFTIDASPDRLFPGRRCLYDGLIILTFIVIGGILSMLIFLLCGCRRTIWSRTRSHGQRDHFTLVNMPSNYDI